MVKDVSTLFLLRTLAAVSCGASVSAATLMWRRAVRVDDGAALISGALFGMAFLAGVAAVLPWR
jgi:hypothetical protein